MRPPAFNPPYDSPIETDFAYLAAKRFDESTDLSAQVQMRTRCGLFIVDFVAIDCSGRRVGFECDGKEFHDESRDEWRDAVILGEGHVDQMWRLPGASVYWSTDDLMFVISRYEPTLFSERGLRNLEALRSDRVRDVEFPDNARLRFTGYNEDGELRHLKLERRVTTAPLDYWKKCYAFIARTGATDLDAAIAAYRRELELQLR